MKHLGDFREFSSMALGPSISASLDDEMPDRLRRLVAFYLVQGGVLQYVMERLPDVFDKEELFLTGGVRTDGEWYWRADLAHYVMKYGVTLPEEFLAHAAWNGWSPPELSEIERGRLARNLRQP